MAEAVNILGLKHAVITSVNRDELPDGGAAIWAATIRQVKALNPDCTVEALIPDFEGVEASLLAVLEAKPDILAHNTETVPRLYRTVRPQAKYPRSLELLQRAKQRGFVTKSGVMVGLGEEWEELRQVMRDLCAVQLRYPDHWPVFAAVTTAPPGATHLYAGGISATAPGRSDLGFQACGSGAISAQFVPCRRAKSQDRPLHPLGLIASRPAPIGSLRARRPVVVSDDFCKAMVGPRKEGSMASQIVMPKMSETMEEGVVVKWLKREGDRVASGDALAEIETDKAVLELEATTAGVLHKILAQEDSKVPVGQLLAVIGAEDEDVSSLIGRSSSPIPQPA